jgi:spermidine synthase
MKPWRFLAAAEMPGGGRLTLHAHDAERVIRIDGQDLMSSRMHGSEEELARLGLETAPADARVLVGGLGMGFTLRAALDLLGSEARVDVAELAPAIVEWNRTELAPFASRPLEDARVTVIEADVARVIAGGASRWNAILLDVDNGPAALSRANEGLYGPRSLARMHHALAPGGVLAVWSAVESSAFTTSLARAGFGVRVERTRARGARGGPRHVIWLARRPSARPVTK